MKKETLGLVQIFIASLLFGFIPILVRWGDNLGPYNLSFFRVFVSILSLGLFFWISKKYTLVKFKFEKKKMILFGAIHGFIILGYFMAIQYLSVASAVLLLYSSSIWIIIFSHFILKEKITRKTVFALVIAFIGVIFVLSPKSLLIFESFVGSIAGLLAGIGFGLVYVLSKTFKKYDKVSLTFWQNTIALPFLIPLLLIDIPKFTPNDIGIVVLLGTICTTLPFILVFKGFEKVSAQKGGIVILLDVLFPVILALAIFQEVPTIEALIGGVLIVIGFLLVTNSK